MGTKRALICVIYRPGHGKGFFIDFFADDGPSTLAHVASAQSDYWESEEEVQLAIANNVRTLESEGYVVSVTPERQWNLDTSPFEFYLDHAIDHHVG